VIVQHDHLSQKKSTGFNLLRDGVIIAKLSSQDTEGGEAVSSFLMRFREFFWQAVITNVWLEASLEISQED